MFDETAPSAPLQRVHGRAAVRISAGGRLVDLHQSGAAKAMLPRMHGRPPEVVFLNTAGGVTGGDRLSYELVVEEGAHVVGTTQTAERAYRSPAGRGDVQTHLTLGDNAILHWLPQEVILFDGASMQRRLTVTMADTAQLVMLETLVLGRAAMGEVLRQIDLSDRRDVWCGGTHLMREAIHLSDADLARSTTAGLDGAVALSTLSLFSTQAADRLDALRATLPPGGGLVRAAASAWSGRVTARFMSADAYALRRAVAHAVPVLTQAPLPRVWQI